MSLTIPIYIILFFAIIFTAIYLSKTIDRIQKQTHASSALLGGVVLALVTSLPEFFSAFSAVIIVKEPAMAFGDLIGSNLIDLIMVALFIIFGTHYFYKTHITKSNLLLTILSAIMFLLLVVNIFLPFKTTIPFVNINFFTLVFVFIYFFSLKFTKEEDVASNEPPVIYKKELSTKSLIFIFVGLAILLIAESISISIVTDKLANKYNINKNVAGSLLLGIVTSLPEFVASLSLIRLKNYNMAFGNLVGSVVFNFFIFGITDAICYYSTIWLTDTSALIISCCSLAVAILLAICFWLQRKNNKAFNSLQNDATIDENTKSIKAKKFVKTRWIYLTLSLMCVLVGIAYLILSFTLC